MSKERFYPNKLLKIVLVIFGLLLLIYVFFSIKLGDPVCYEREHNLGWDCWYSSFSPFIPPIKNFEYQRKCERDGGEYRSMVVTPKMAYSGPFTLNHTGPYFYCILPFSDYGKECKKDGDCQGFCCEFVGDIPEFCKTKDGKNFSTDFAIFECSQDIVGKCSKGLCRSGSGKRTVEGNKIIQDWLIFDN